MNISPDIAFKYDYFVTGSDQVWRDNFFLRFADKKQRICISPSFGVSEISEKFKSDYVDGLNCFEYLCAREKAGVDIMYSLTDRRADLLIDLTLALEKKQWQGIAAYTENKGKSYILLAMLGKLTDEKKDYIKKLQMIII